MSLCNLFQDQNPKSFSIEHCKLLATPSTHQSQGLLMSQVRVPNKGFNIRYLATEAARPAVVKGRLYSWTHVNTKAQSLRDQPEKLALMPKPAAEFSHPLSPTQTCQASGKFAEWIVVVFQSEAYVTSKIRSFIRRVALSLW